MGRQTWARRERVRRQFTEAGGNNAGSPVHISLGAANHDERVFSRPEEFDITRPSHPHLAFATGAHTCLGLQLARAEMAAICTVVLDRLVGIQLSLEVTDVHVGGIAYRSPASDAVRRSHLTGA